MGRATAGLQGIRHSQHSAWLNPEPSYLLWQPGREAALHLWISRHSGQTERSLFEELLLSSLLAVELYLQLWDEHEMKLAELLLLEDACLGNVR